jgi:hypothetical protein
MLWNTQASTVSSQAMLAIIGYAVLLVTMLIPGNKDVRE